LSKKKSPVSKSIAKAKPASSIAPTSPMDVSLLEQMVKLMSANDLNTVDVRDGDKRVILKRGAVQMVSHATHHHTAPSSVPAPAGTSPAPAPTPVAAPADDSAGLVAIKSPMVGTFYSSPSPDSKPFVSVGSQVDEETDVCTIEAMKNFMPIKAETRGTIAKVLVTNGQTVQYGTPLFMVKP
jgi:acetyl-CoA carboxylase biotin carboxyl carrier protein